jgi:DMSO reductase anchor subunit
MRPAWSVILLTTLIGAAQGLFLAVLAVAAFRRAPQGFVLLSCAISFLLLAFGLLASFFHLGRPQRAWRAASQWRTSWLSREVIVLPGFMGMVFLYGVLNALEVARTFVIMVGLVGATFCIALFICTGMIYACLEFLQEWHTPLTPLNYFLLGTASGFTLAVPVAVLTFPQFAGVLALAAFSISAAAYLMRCASLVRNARLRPKSTRELFHGRPERVVRAARWAFLILAFPVPAWLLGWGGGSLQACVAAFAIQFAGLLAERWYFFAEARHPQNLYYQSMA